MDPTLLPPGWNYRCVQQYYVYISLPSNDPDCTDLDLPPLSTGWSYHCVPANLLTKSDGTGWLPLDLISSNITTLPIDPINDAATIDYYAYVAAGDPNSPPYVITSALDSETLQTQVAQTDNGSDPTRIEKGNLTLWQDANGVIASWPSGKERNEFDGVSTEHIIQNSARLEMGKRSQSFGVVVKFRTAAVRDQSLVEKWDGDDTAYPFALRGPLPYLQFSSYDRSQLLKISTPTGNYSDNQWHIVVGQRDAIKRILSMFVDRKAAGQITDDISTDINNAADIRIGNRSTIDPKHFLGEIAFVVIFNRVLLPAEIERMY